MVKEVEHVTEGKDVNLTARGMIVGTPAYMAPEMALGTKEVDGRADLYALGCVAYWLLTGTVPFPTESAMQTLVKHANETPEPPSARSELPIPPELDQLVSCCLQKKPEDRPANAKELAARLSSIPIEPSWTEEKACEWWNTHRPAS
jgi:serine/threonine-protein kinase